MNYRNRSLPTMPSRIRKLRVDARGYPVPWFVAWVDSVPDFRAIEAGKIPLAVRDKCCWICGKGLGVHLTFPIGPMCAVNRTIAEPPSHHDCAEFSARACPFLTLPAARRREANMPTGATEPAGLGIKRNPGVVCLWTTRTYQLFRAGDIGGGGRDGVLFRLGDPEQVEWFAEGRKATRAEVQASVLSGLPLLEKVARAQGREALAALCVAHVRASDYWPAPA